MRRRTALNAAGFLVRSAALGGVPLASAVRVRRARRLDQHQRSDHACRTARQSLAGGFLDLLLHQLPPDGPIPEPLAARIQPARPCTGRRPGASRRRDDGALPKQAAAQGGRRGADYPGWAGRADWRGAGCAGRWDVGGGFARAAGFLSGPVMADGVEKGGHGPGLRGGRSSVPALSPLRAEGVGSAWRVCAGSGRLRRGGTRLGCRGVLATAVGPA